MRKIIIFLLLIVVIIICKTDVKKKNTIFLGEIKNLENETVMLQNFSRNFKKEIILKPNGAFLDTVKKTFRYYFIKVRAKEISCYLPEGTSLTISLDAKNIDKTITFKGENAKENTYLFEKEKLKKELNKDEEVLFSLSELAFIAKLKEIEKQLNNKAKITNLSSNFLAQEIKNNHYNYLLDITRYEEYHQYYSKNISFKVSESYPLKKEIASFDFDNEIDYYSSRAYKYIRHRFFTLLADKEVKETKKDVGIALIDVVDSKMKHQSMKNEYLFYNLQGMLGGQVENLKGLYNRFMDVSTDDKYKKVITKIYNNLKRITKGNPSPKFVNYENYKEGTTSLDDLKGKYVYIDIWATWCAPCKGEIPYLQKLEKKYHSKNITFVSISIDRKKAKVAWQKMIQEKKMTGIQLFADNAFKSEFIKKYAINTIPRFILIDPDGNIVSSNAPRPSNPKLIRIFNFLGIK